LVAQRLSVIVPALNEAAGIVAALQALAPLRTRGHELVVADGGSGDGTLDIVRRRGVPVVEGPRGRGPQMHAGALAAGGDVLWFLHADTHPPGDAADLIREALADPRTVAGHFALRFDGDRRSAGLLTWIYPRLRYLGLCYGDSGIFVRREAYERVGGFRPYPIFEDLDLLTRLRRLGRVARLEAAVVTSSRRFEGRSFALTFAWWTLLQLLYWIGVPPRHLGRMYAHIRGPRPKGRISSAEPPEPRVDPCADSSS
jgi:rSAM/selenodomain-associated transferase 2